MVYGEKLKTGNSNLVFNKFYYKSVYKLAALLVILSGYFVSINIAQSITLDSSLFTPSESQEKVFVLGVVRYKGISNYQQDNCSVDSICLHMESWHLYEIEGYFLPDNRETDVIKVAHRNGAALYTETIWLATLEKITATGLREGIGADYRLVGVELGSNVFCPSEKNRKLFKSKEADFKNTKTQELCFAM